MPVAALHRIEWPRQGKVLFLLKSKTLVPGWSQIIKKRCICLHLKLS